MNENVISMQRVAWLFRFYSRGIAIQLSISAAVVVVGYLIALWGMSFKSFLEGPFLPAYSFGTGLAELPYYCGPLLFAMCRRRWLATALPATWQEKALVALGYSLVLVPLFLAAVWYASMGVASIFTDSANVDAGMHAMMIRLMEQVELSINDLWTSSRTINILTSVFTCSAVLWAVEMSRHNRFSMGIVALLATKFMLFVAGLVYGIMAAMHIADNVVTTDGDEGKIQVNGIINYVNSITPWYEAALVLLILVLLGWSVYLIKNRHE